MNARLDMTASFEILSKAESRIRQSLVGCWEWTGALHKAGYGELFVEGKRQRAHRLVYEALVGPIPAGMHLDHLCRNRRCVRPDHLEPVTPKENVHRGESIPARNAAKTHCIAGHPFSEANTYIYFDRKGRMARVCKTCARRRASERNK